MREMFDVDHIERLRADLWLSEALAGRVWVPHNVCAEAGMLLLEAVTARYGMTDGQGPITLRIDTHSGDNKVFYVTQMLEKFAQSKAIVRGGAISAGLVLAVACKERIARSARCHFAWHGSMYKPELDSSKQSDEARVDWITQRTTAPREFWEEKAVSGKPYDFRAEEAVSLGVIHRIEGSE